MLKKASYMFLLIVLTSMSVNAQNKIILPYPAARILCQSQFNAVRKTWGGQLSDNVLITQAVDEIKKSNYSFSDLSTEYGNQLTEETYSKQLKKTLVSMRNNRKAFSYDIGKFLASMDKQQEACMLQLTEPNRLQKP